MTTATQNVIKRQPRWSDVELYYRCDYDTYRKLKSIHKWYYQTLRDFARWERWDRKFPHNRKGPEPKFCSFFLNRWGTRVEDKGFIHLYHQARMPSVEPVDPFDGEQIEKINKAYAKIASYFLEK
jgi:hypothetical protein